MNKCDWSALTLAQIYQCPGVRMEWVSLKTLVPLLYRVLALEGCTAVICGPPAVRLTSSHPTAPTFYHKVSHTHAYVCMYICTNVPRYLCTYIHTVLYVRIYIHTCAYVCVYVNIIREMVCICTLLHTSLAHRVDLTAAICFRMHVQNLLCQ